MAARNNFLNTPEERHAFTIGLCEVIAPTPPRWHIIGPDLMRTLNDEYHYYALGRATGTIAWFAIVLSLLSIIF